MMSLPVGVDVVYEHIAPLLSDADLVHMALVSTAMRDQMTPSLQQRAAQLDDRVRPMVDAMQQLIDAFFAQPTTPKAAMEEAGWTFRTYCADKALRVDGVKKAFEVAGTYSTWGSGTINVGIEYPVHSQWWTGPAFSMCFRPLGDEWWLENRTYLGQAREPMRLAKRAVRMVADARGALLVPWPICRYPSSPEYVQTSPRAAPLSPVYNLTSLPAELS